MTNDDNNTRAQKLASILPADRSRIVLYVCHPVAPLPEELADYELHPEPRGAAVDANIRRALRWLRWLMRSFPETTFVMPWVAGVLAGDPTQRDPKQREAGLVDCEATVSHLHGAVLVGGRVSGGMKREADAAWRNIDLTFLGAEPPAVVSGATFRQWCAQIKPAPSDDAVTLGGES